MTGTGRKAAGVRWLPVLLGALALVAVAVALVLRERTLSTGVPYPPILGLVLAPPMLAFVAVGAFIAARRPRNGVGWVLASMGLIELWASGVLGWAAALAHVRGDAATAGILGDVGNSLSLAGPGLLALVLIMFPRGTLPQGRALLRLVQVIIGWMVLVVVVGLLLPMGHPLRVTVQQAVQPLVLPVGYLALLVRYRLATGLDRQQLTWVVTGSTVLVVGHVTYFISMVAGRAQPTAAARVGISIVVVGMLTLAAAVAIGILRYRLFDIDRLLKRTAVYAMVTTVLGALYATVAIVPVLVTNVTRRSDLVVALATLVAAAAFGPVRRRAQLVVDRRFDRHHYDAVRTVEVFGARLREQIDIDALAAELVAASHRTVGPSGAMVWLAPAHESRDA